ncbi:hypothetical protein [Coxiella endosymbiont of Ornithodoros amblus]|uniref:hypothetical protein n=1 Tax=Coxiella endosymbiont of Ornithodoros amblus TaxID=1656166 RepID=UPI00244DBD23|nr:hypothetical protein [Coxiella endosymbiont of Ornithodoros amblus]
MSCKENRIPVTEIDLSAHKILQKGLNSLMPTIPILSKEGKIFHLIRCVRKGSDIG